MGDGRDVGRKYVGGIGCGSVWRLGRGEVGSVGNVSCGFSFLFLGFGWVETSYF